eukprot:365023-Chlamydomonas_euryale.AAC.32
MPAAGLAEVPCVPGRRGEQRRMARRAARRRVRGRCWKLSGTAWCLPRRGTACGKAQAERWREGVRAGSAPRVRCGGPEWALLGFRGVLRGREGRMRRSRSVRAPGVDDPIPRHKHTGQRYLARACPLCGSGVAAGSVDDWARASEQRSASSGAPDGRVRPRRRAVSGLILIEDHLQCVQNGETRLRVVGLHVGWAGGLSPSGLEALAHGAGDGRGWACGRAGPKARAEHMQWELHQVPHACFRLASTWVPQQRT